MVSDIIFEIHLLWYTISMILSVTEHGHYSPDVTTWVSNYLGQDQRWGSASFSMWLRNQIRIRIIFNVAPEPDPDPTFFSMQLRIPDPSQKNRQMKSTFLSQLVNISKDFMFLPDYWNEKLWFILLKYWKTVKFVTQINEIRIFKDILEVEMLFLLGSGSA